MDAVIAYVDGMEPVWRMQYNKTYGGLLYYKTRFTDFGTLKYVLRGISEHMKFIDRVFLVVSNIEQVPDYVGDNVIVITHDMFIPKVFLPTFNANTIECFLWNIPNLSEEFIYFNDDIIPIGKMEKEDFFRDGLPCLTFKINKTTSEEFNQIISNDNRFAVDFGDGVPMEEFLWTSNHIMTPFLKSEYCKAYNQNSYLIQRYTTPVRQGKQFSQHYFSNMLYYQKKYINYSVESIYTQSQIEVDDFVEILSNKGAKKVLCINDNGCFLNKTTKETKTILEKELNNLLPQKGIYER